MQTKIVVIFLLFIILPIIFLAYVSYYNFANTIEHKTTDYVSQINSGMMDKLGRYIFDMNYFTMIPLYSTELQSLLLDSYESLYGQIASSWEIHTEGTLRMEIQIPPNTTAQVILPKALIDQVLENGAELHKVEGILHYEQFSESVMLDMVSGSYCFVYAFSRE